MPYTGWTRLSTYSVRCKPCNRQHSALQRLWGKEPFLRDSFLARVQNDEHARAAFITRSRNIVGKELKALVETAVKETITERKSTKRRTAIEFVDSPDLKKRYHDKPEQLEYIRARGEAFTHPHTNARMYGVTTYTQEQHHFTYAMCKLTTPHCNPAKYNQPRAYHMR